MNREILFRGKRVDSGEWIYGHFCELPCDDGTDIPSILRIENKENDRIIMQYPIISETVGRYTGLTDRNGKKIFEGDIIECDLERFIVEWDDEFAGFYLSDIYPDYQGCSTLSDISRDGCIIGNIHDNLELIGV